MFTKWRNCGHRDRRRLRWNQFKLIVRHLDERIAPAIFFVSNTNDAGPGSLRQAVLDANNSTDPLDTVDAQGITGTINLLSLVSLTGATEILGPGADKLQISGHGNVQILDATKVGASMTVRLSKLSLINGKADTALTTYSAGAIAAATANVVIQHCTFAGNTNSKSGGGSSLSVNGGNLTISYCIIEENSSATYGSAVFTNQAPSVTIVASTFSSNIGSGLNVYGATLVTVDGCTFVGNAATSNGGAIGATLSGSPVPNGVIRNSTISGNSARYGGGLSISGGKVVIQNCTIANNSAQYSSGGVYISSSTSLSNSIVAANLPEDLSSSYGVTIAGNRNLIGSAVNVTFSGVGNLVGTPTSPLDPLLLPLANYGGPTFTNALGPGSPALEAGDNATGLATDQRGFPRVVGAAADIGAYEAGLNPIARLTVPITFIPGATQQSISMTYQDVLGSMNIDLASLGAGDLMVRGPNGFLAIPSLTGSSGSGATVTATYVFTPPGGSWDANDNGVYSIDVNANSVFDTDTPTPLSVSDLTLANVPTFIYLVDSVNDEDDGNTSPGHQSLREAIRLANTINREATDTIIFDPVLFGTPQTIALNPGLDSLEIVDAVTIIGPGADLLTISGGASDYSVESEPLLASTKVEISGVTFINAPGTALATNTGQVTVRACRFNSNSYAMAVYSGGFLTIDLCSVSENRTGIYATGELAIQRSTFERNQQGVFNYYSAPLTIDQSLFANNVSPGYDGGAIRWGGGSVLIRNSTLVGNSAINGGAIYLTQGNLQIINSTMASNSATLWGGGIYLGSSSPTISLISSILADNQSRYASDMACAYATKVAADHSIIGVANDGNFTVAGTGNLTGTLDNPINPRLFPLAANGGPTRTMAPMPDSPAIDLGSNPNGFLVDQRGFPRLVGSAIDIGALEFGPEPLASAVAADITSPGNTIINVTVNYSDLIGGGINLNTLGTGDIDVRGSAGFIATPTFIGAISNGPTVTATYTFSPPTGGWDQTKNGAYVISVVPNAVLDLDSPIAHSAAAGQIAQFDVIIPRHFVVDTVVDEDDGNYASGDLSLREAIDLANSGLARTQDVITFDPIAFGVPQTITLDPTLYYVSLNDAVDVQGPGPSLLTIRATSTQSTFFMPGVITGPDVRFSGFTFAGTAGFGDYYSALILRNCVFDGEGTSSGSAVGNTYQSASLTLEDCTIRDYHGDSQPAILCYGSLTIRRCSVTGNSNRSRGGGVYAGGPSLTIEDSTISGNTAGYLGAPNVQGGGVFSGFLHATPNDTGTLLIRNSTISNNRVIGSSGSGNGGGIFTYAAHATIENSTIADNQANKGGGFFAGFYPVALTMHSTVVAGNIGQLDINATSSFTVAGSNNLVGYTTVKITGTNNLIGAYGSPINPRLAPLADNGGPTKTRAPLPGSPLINAGSNPNNLINDQRGTGFARTVGGQTDIGAFEVQTPPPRALSVQVNEGAVQRSIVTGFRVTFSEPVVFPFGATAAFDLQRSGPSGPTGTVNFVALQTGNVVMITFAAGGPIALDPGGSLIDGNYKLSIVAGKVIGVGGQLDGNSDGAAGDNFNFLTHRLFGDSNGDGRVDTTDFTAFRSAFGVASPVFDFNNDGVVNSTDFVEFRKRFGLMI